MADIPLIDQGFYGNDSGSDRISGDENDGGRMNTAFEYALEADIPCKDKQISTAVSSVLKTSHLVLILLGSSEWGSF